jgi:putative transposase
VFAAEIRKRRIQDRYFSLWRWHLDEVFVRINGEQQDREAALRFLRKAMKRYARPEVIVTDLLRSYPAAMNTIGNAERREIGRWLNNLVENSHQPFRRRERAIAK